MEDVRVMIADDHAIVRAGFRRLVEQIPGLVISGEIGNGVEVIPFIEAHPLDLLLIDLTMPNFEPISAIKAIRSRWPDLKILVVSAYDDQFYVKGLLEFGVHGYHLKDESLSDLKLAIERVLEGERWISSSLINKLLQEDEGISDFPELTGRQLDLLRYLKQGLDNKSISAEMGISIKTVESHLTRLYRRLNVQSRLEAVNYVNKFPQILGIGGRQITHKTREPVSGEGALAVLVLDDSTRYRKQLVNMIAKASPSARIFEAGRISEALQLVEQVDIRLAFIDVILKDEDGISCVRQVRRIKPDLRVVLISAYPDREFHRQGLAAGASAFLDKKNLDLLTIKHVINDIE